MIRFRTYFNFFDDLTSRNPNMPQAFAVISAFAAENDLKMVSKTARQLGNESGVAFICSEEAFMMFKLRYSEYIVEYYYTEHA